MPSRHFSSVQLDLRKRPCADEGISHHAGFNEWAEANDLVIFYPAMTSWGVTGQTKAGCWDGCECLAPTSSFSTSLIRGVCADAQTGSDYALKSGAQVSVVRNVIRGVAGV